MDQKYRSVEMTEDQWQGVVGLLNSAVKAEGLSSAAAAVFIFDKIKAAPSYVKEEPTEKKE